MNTPRSPLPWEHGDNGLIYGQCTGDNDEAPVVADVIGCHQRAPLGILTDRERADAEFIVRACNTHAELVDALKIALVALNTAPRFSVHGHKNSYAIAARLGALLRKAGAQ